MVAKDHNRLLGIFHLIQGGLQAFAGIIVALAYGGMGISLRNSAYNPEQQMMGNIFVVLAFIVAPFLLIIAGINLMAGFKLLKERAGARTWGIIASIISLISIPLGTALGVYGLWFFFGEEGRSFYLGGERQPNMLNTPPANNWR